MYKSYAVRGGLGLRKIYEWPKNQKTKINSKKRHSLLNTLEYSADSHSTVL